MVIILILILTVFKISRFEIRVDDTPIESTTRDPSLLAESIERIFLKVRRSLTGDVCRDENLLELFKVFSQNFHDSNVLVLILSEHSLDLRVPFVMVEALGQDILIILYPVSEDRSRFVESVRERVCLQGLDVPGNLLFANVRDSSYIVELEHDVRLQLIVQTIYINAIFDKHVDVFVQW